MGLSSPGWERRYARKLLLSDTAIVIIAVFGAQIIRFGPAERRLAIFEIDRQTLLLSYSLLSVILVLGWMAALAIGDTRDFRVYAIGNAEYQRVINSTFVVFGIYAIFAFVAHANIGRGYLFLALPIGLALLLFSRWFWRKTLRAQRKSGQNVYRTLIVGEPVKSAHIATQILRNPDSGFQLQGVVTEAGAGDELLPGVPILGEFDQLLSRIDELEIDVLVLTSSDTLDPIRMRHIGWELESRNVSLIVAAALVDIAGPRIHTRPFSGLPLIYVDYPRLGRFRQLTKRSTDLLIGSVTLLCVSPILLAIAIAIRLDSPGPIVFRQRRVGMAGVEFPMLKFRSMVADAEDRLPGLLDRSNGNKVLFKMKNDPRVTRVGRFIRRYSLDELPQLVNVVRGQMSLVGPRPPLVKETESYEDYVRRRLLVKPGMTGLWQVSGRSKLSWEDSVRLDLYYVENWSTTGDIALLWRTIGAVLRPSGAY